MVALPTKLYAVILHLTPEVKSVFAEYLESMFTLGEVLENKSASLRQQVLAELSQYFDIRDCNGMVELYFKKGEIIE
jgi:hypothetical protein